MSHPKSRSGHGKSLVRILRSNDTMSDGIYDALTVLLALGPSTQQTTLTPPSSVIPAGPTDNTDAATELSEPLEHTEEKGKEHEVQEASINKAYESTS